jgi:hypothetical protein
MSRVDGLHARYKIADAPLNRGGIGAIYPASDANASFVYKKYFVPAKAPSVDNLRRLVDIGRDVLIGQNKTPGDTPESSVNWPIDVVLGRRDQTALGVILPAIPRPLLNEFGKPRGLEFLILARTNPPTAKGRVVLLLRMAEIQAYVDALELVHGDINSKNLAWTLRPHPITYLIDCDGMVPQYPPPQTGVHAMGWVDPRVVEKLIPAPDHMSDRYALALAMYRGLLLVSGHLKRLPDGTWQAPSQIPSELPARIRRLLERGLGRPLDGELRPKPAEWVAALIETYLAGGRYDETALSTLEALTEARRVAMKRAASARFVRIPQTDWDAIALPANPRPTGAGVTGKWIPPPGPTPPRPSAPPPPYQGRVPPPPPPRQHTPPQMPPSRVSPHPRAPTPPGPVQAPVAPRQSSFNYSKLGLLGRRALRRGPFWHLLCLVLTAFFYSSLLVTIPSYLQLKRAGAKATSQGRAAMRASLGWALAPVVLVGLAIASPLVLKPPPPEPLCPSIREGLVLRVGERTVIRVRGTPATRVRLAAPSGLRLRRLVRDDGVARFTVRPRRSGRATIRAPKLDCPSVRVRIRPRRGIQSKKGERRS